MTKRVTDLIATVNSLEGTVKGINGTVSGLNGTVNGINGTLGNLAPIIHSIAQREYATCYHASNTDSLITMSVKERLDACYGGYYTFGMFRPNDLYSDPAP